MSCTGDQQELFNDVQAAIDCMCTGTTGQTASLCQSAALAALANEPPFSCMIDLLTGQYSDCGTTIPDEQRQAALAAFEKVTGWQPADLVAAFNTITSNQRSVLSYNAFYFCIPVLIILLVGVWMAFGYGVYNWIIALFLTVFVVVVMYGAAVFYRLQTQNFLANQSKTVIDNLQQAQDSLENSVAYWPQGLFAVACAVTASTGTTGWQCNEPGCVDCDTNAQIIKGAKGLNLATQSEITTSTIDKSQGSETLKSLLDQQREAQQRLNRIRRTPCLPCGRGK